MYRLQQALELIKTGQLQRARLILEELLSEDPDSGDVLYNLGMCYTELDKPEAAIELLSRFIKHYPHHSNAHVAMGFAQSKIHNFKKAKEFFERALDIDPQNSYALRNLGGLFGKEGNHDKAIEYLLKSYSINPEDQNTLYGLGLSYFNIGDLGRADNFLKLTIKIGQTTTFATMAKDLLREIAVINLKSKGFRTDAMFYCLAALQYYDTKSLEEIRNISFEIGLKGAHGLDINNPDRKYKLNSMQGLFSGLQLVSYMYVGFKSISQETDIGIDLSEEYEIALNLFKKVKAANGYTIH